MNRIVMLPVILFLLMTQEKLFASSIENHWQWPMPEQHLQGWQDADLFPAACGSCHVQQFEDWQKSRHARAFGPGLLGQFKSSGYLEDSVSCSQCHAPLSRQQSFVPDQPYEFSGETSRTCLEESIVRLDSPARDLKMNTKFNRSLRDEGIVCAACHIRDGKITGPFERDKPPVIVEGEGKKHDAVQRLTIFEESDFCRDCHQFTQKVNGKPLQNTYAEWDASIFADKGMSCQSCHMPERRHWWRGIHSKDWVGGALLLQMRILPQLNSYQVEVSIKNSGVGHYFPTYITPMAELSLQYFEQDDSNSVWTQSAKIGRKVAMNNGVWQEIFDSRIAPQDSFVLNHSLPLDSSGYFVAKLEVQPDAYYENLYRQLLQQAQYAKGQRRKLIEEALAEASSSAYFAAVEEFGVEELLEDHAGRK